MNVIQNGRLDEEDDEEDVTKKRFFWNDNLTKLLITTYTKYEEERDRGKSINSIWNSIRRDLEITCFQEVTRFFQRNNKSVVDGKLLFPPTKRPLTTIKLQGQKGRFFPISKNSMRHWETGPT